MQCRYSSFGHRKSSSSQVSVYIAQGQQTIIKLKYCTISGDNRLDGPVVVVVGGGGGVVVDITV